MKLKKIKRIKRVCGTLLLAALIFCTSAVCEAAPKQYYSAEGIGFDVKCPTDNLLQTQGNKMGVAKASETDGEYVSVYGGTLWTTWNNTNVTFRANYIHSTKTHRCSVTNTRATKRSEWTAKKYKAVSPYLEQALVGNKSWANVK